MTRVQALGRRSVRCRKFCYFRGVYDLDQSGKARDCLFLSLIIQRKERWMAMKLGTGAEQYGPMARAITGGLTSSVVLTVFIVPAAYLLV